MDTNFNTLQDVNIYRGRNLVVTRSRLEISSKSPYLLDLLSTLNICGCKDSTALIFPEEDEEESSLKEAFNVSIKGFAPIHGNVSSLTETLNGRLGQFNVLIKTENIEEIIGKSKMNLLLSNGYVDTLCDGLDDDDAGDYYVNNNGSKDMDESIEIQEDSRKESDEEGNLDSSISTVNSPCSGPCEAPLRAKVTKFQCGLCLNSNKSYKSECDLNDHYSTHFKTELQNFTDGQVCLICGKKVNKTHRHVGGPHRMVEEFLGESLQIPKRVDDSSRYQTEAARLRSYEFKLCPKTKKITFKVGSLESSRHFKDDLKQFIIESQIGCQTCGRIIADICHLVRHVGLAKAKKRGQNFTKKRKRISQNDHSALNINLMMTENINCYGEKENDDIEDSLGGNSPGKKDNEVPSETNTSPDIDDMLIESLLLDSD